MNKSDRAAVTKLHSEIGRSGGIATPEQWETWIESPEAAKMGFCFKT